MSEDIRIIEKPESISWDTIHEVIWQAHTKNRSIGVIMRYPSLSGEEIKKRIAGLGKMLVAITSEGNVVGTAAIIPKTVSTWFGEQEFAYCCFAAVLPSYSGRGIYKDLCVYREGLAREMGLSKMLFDTHSNNKHVIDYSVRNGFRPITEKRYNDHYNVVMVKWLDGCPYSRFRCSVNFMVRRTIVHIRSIIKCALKSS